MDKLNKLKKVIATVRYLNPERRTLIEQTLEFTPMTLRISWPVGASGHASIRYTFESSQDNLIKDAVDYIYENYSEIDMILELKTEIKMYDINTKLHEWYMEVFPFDDIGSQLSPEATFNDLHAALQNHADVDGMFAIRDCIVRDRVLRGLADLMNMEYGYVYDLWMEYACVRRG